MVDEGAFTPGRWIHGKDVLRRQAEARSCDQHRLVRRGVNRVGAFVDVLGAADSLGRGDGVLAGGQGRRKAIIKLDIARGNGDGRDAAGNDRNWIAHGVAERVRCPWAGAAAGWMAVSRLARSSWGGAFFQASIHLAGGATEAQTPRMPAPGVSARAQTAKWPVPFFGGFSLVV